MAIRVDQAAALTSRLDRTAIFDLEERICARFAALLRASDPITIWLEFGFGVLVQRETPDEVRELAERLCASVAHEAFLVGLESCDMTLSVGFALAPRTAAGDDAHQWFAAAHAAQGMANRHGGNAAEGLLTREFEPMPAERVLIIREWVQEAKSGNNVIIEFQPLIPLNSAATDLYSIHAKLRDQRAPLGGVYRDEYLRLARDAGAMVMIDRMSLFHAFETLDQERAHGRQTRLMVSVDLATLDGLPWRWLEAELRRRQHLVDGLILELEATDALRDAHGVACLVRLRKLGVRVCLSYRSANLEQASAWCQLPADVMRVQYPALDAHPPPIARALLARWRALGRQVIVDEVEQTGAMTQLADLGIDYLRGHALAAIGMRLDFEFSVAP